jgi:hypothetical protein
MRLSFLEITLLCSLCILIGLSIHKKPVVKNVVIEEQRPAPYWTVYGLPTYWPFYLSPYDYYGLPYTGPINNPYEGRKELYKPHGHRPGYTNMAVN